VALHFVAHRGVSENGVAETFLHHRLGEGDAVRLDLDMQADATLERGMLDQPAVAVGHVRQDQRQLGEVADAEAQRVPAPLAAPGWRADHQHAFAQKRPDIKRFEVRRIVQNGDVDALLQQPFLQQTGDALAHVQRGLRPGLLESLGESRDEQASRRRRRADGDAAAGRRTPVADFLAGLVHELRNRLGAFQEQRAGGAQPHAAAVARKQRDAEFVLELLDLAAQGRLRQAQFFRRPADAAGAGDVHEVAQFSDVHAGP
jgi:hypothetical protein